MEKPFRPLGARVVGWSLLCSALFSLAMTAALIVIDYQDAQDEALRQLRFAASSYRKSLANGLWELDMPAVRLQLDGIASFPMVGEAVLTTSAGERIESGVQAVHEAVGPLSWKEPLFSPHNPQRQIGELLLLADQQALHRRVEANAIRILTGEALKGLLFGLLIAWLIARLVTRHLSHMATQLASLAPNALGRPLALQRSASHHRDELDQLLDAFNKLNRHLAEHLDMKRALEEELREHRDRLSEMVSERTRSLERLRDFHNLIIRVLTRFINVPPGQANEAVEFGLGAFCDYFGADRCLILTYDRFARRFHAENAWPPTKVGGANLILPDEALARHLVVERRSRVWICTTTDEDPDNAVFALLGCSAYTAVGVDVKGATSGLLCLVGCAVPRDTERASLLDLAARVAASMLDHKAAQATLIDAQQALQRANRELHALSRHDALTGLPNRRYLDEVKDVEFRRALRSGWPMSILMCDLDEFKRYNDTYGHAQGDRCLNAFAACLVQLFNRAGELPVRLGGEEFAVVLPNTDIQQAAVLTERLRQTVWEMNLPHVSSTVADRVTVSIGIASLKHGGHHDFDSLLQDADSALYLAKKQRNRAVLAE